jgi:hypothetical protein
MLSATRADMMIKLRRDAAAAVCIWMFLGLAGVAPAEEALPNLLTSSGYAEKLAEYEALHGSFEEEARSYWQSVAAKRKSRFAKRSRGEPPQLDDYVLDQPPVYNGPPKPVDPTKPPDEATRPAKAAMPVVADFVKHALEQYGFVPDRPSREDDFKRAYVKVAREAGLTRDQVVRVYGFESGGNGKYDVQAGLEHPGPDSHAISTALGYNQLLNTNSVELLAEKGNRFLDVLRRKASNLRGSKRKLLFSKIGVVERMIAFSKTVPDEWSAHERIAGEQQGLGIHALNLDIEVGPLLQTQKLLDSVVFAKTRNYVRPLTAAELEMMNLTGDGSGFDMISLPQDTRDQIPTTNFFQRNGYERNPVASRNPTVAKLIAATDAVMNRESVLQGAKAMGSLYDRAGGGTAAR